MERPVTLSAFISMPSSTTASDCSLAALGIAQRVMAAERKYDCDVLLEKFYLCLRQPDRERAHAAASNPTNASTPLAGSGTPERGAAKDHGVEFAAMPVMVPTSVPTPLDVSIV